MTDVGFIDPAGFTNTEFHQYRRAVEYAQLPPTAGVISSAEGGWVIDVADAGLDAIIGVLTH
ncbi:MAG: hypothetical protein M3325_06085 [Actinomycetota bacterium]|nr:hypothetical protein [Actinomycetota bacterium]MDQ3904278.1 hypothetical protein [Actinomycetota bacterium]